MKTLLQYFKIALFFVLYLSCSTQSDNVKVLLDKAENSIEQQPDSALSLLHSIPAPENLPQNLYYRYILLQIQAKDKSHTDITSDTIIFTIKDYYAKKKDFPNAALAALYCGRVLYESKSFEKAASAYLEAENYADDVTNDNLKGLIQKYLGTLYYNHLLTEKAIIRGKNAVDLFHKAKNYKRESHSLLLIGNCFVMQNENDSAFYYYNKSLNLANDYTMPSEQVMIKQNIGLTYQREGNYTEAKKWLHEALSFFGENDMEIEKAKILIGLAKVCRLANQPDSAQFYMNQFLSIPIENSDLLASAYLLLSKMEEDGGHHKEALQYHKQYVTYFAKRVEDNHNKALLELQGKYDYEALKNKNEQVVIKIMLIAFIALLLASFIAFYFYIRYIQKKRKVFETEQKIETLMKMAEKYSEKENSNQNILLRHFDILKKAAFMSKYIGEKEQKQGDLLIKKFNKIVYEQEAFNWNALYQSMNELRNGVYTRIQNQYSQLDESEFRICCLCCEKFIGNEIALIMDLSVNTVHKKMTEIRKKIGVEQYANIVDFLINPISEN
jgi:tetratricopeptide (TPR) repeat protein